MAGDPMRIWHAACACGHVRCEARGDPIVSAVCYCSSCQAGARLIEALPVAAPLRDLDGGTPLLTFRKDRFACIAGQESLQGVKLSETAPTTRMVAGCCNSAMYLQFAPGFWISAYRLQFTDPDLPPIMMRNQIRHRSSDLPLPDSAPTAAGFPLGLFARILRARLAMLLGR